MAVVELTAGVLDLPSTGASAQPVAAAPTIAKVAANAAHCPRGTGSARERRARAEVGAADPEAGPRSASHRVLEHTALEAAARDAHRQRGASPQAHAVDARRQRQRARRV